MQEMLSLDYAIFSGRGYDLNIVAKRSKNSVSDKFDDVLNVFYRAPNGSLQGFSYPITSDPGKHWLLNPLNKDGTLIMKPGQYRKVFYIGKHGRSGSNPYTALEQIGDIEYVRDNNKDHILDFDLFADSRNVIKGIFKTNIHRASAWREMLGIGRYSAGCQVFANVNDFDHFMDLCHLQKRDGFGDKFSYTLLA